MTELDLIFNYYMQKIKDEKIREETNNDEDFELNTGANSNRPIDQLYYFITDLRGYGAFPKVVSDKEWEKLLSYVDEKNKVYHGFEYEEYGANYLWDSYYHYGEGTYGSGFYLTDDEFEAMTYTNNKKSRSNNKRVLTTYLNSKNGIMTYELENLAHYLYEGEKDGYLPLLHDDDFYSSPEEKEEHIKLENKRKKMFSDLVEYVHTNIPVQYRDNLIIGMSSNISIIGAYLGYDYSERNEFNKHHFIVFNRGAILTSVSEFNKFVKHAGANYKGAKYERE